MKRLKHIWKYYGTGILLLLAVVLLLGTSITGSRAALQYFSEDWLAHADMKSIGITLTENGEDISSRNYSHQDNAWETTSGALLENLLSDGSTLTINKIYPEELSCRNTGTIPHYARMIVYKYWTDEEGNKLTDLDPALINLHVKEGGSWIEDTTASTTERSVYYYSSILQPGEAAAPLTDTLQIKDGLLCDVTVTTEGEWTYYTYDYHGVKFVIEAEADAVQTHNAPEAIRSAWGIDSSLIQ